MQRISKTRVLKNEITADIKPLFNAVKNADAKILIPTTKNDMLYILIPLVVKLNISWFLPTNIKDNGIAKISVNKNINALGTYSIPIDLYKGIKANITLYVIEKE